MEVHIIISGAWYSRRIISQALCGTNYKCAKERIYTNIHVYENEKQAKKALQIAWTRLKGHKDTWDYYDEANGTLSYNQGHATIHYER